MKIWGESICKRTHKNFLFMNKSLAFLALCCAPIFGLAQDGSFPTASIVNPSISLFRVSAAVGYESEYIFRAEQKADHSIQPKVEFSYPVLGFDVYAGSWMNFPVKRGGVGSFQQLSEIDLYGGANYSFKSFNLDMGYIYYWYTDTPYYMSNNSEVYVGLSMDTASYLGGININPSVYYYYNFELEQHVIEASIGYEVPIGEMTLGMRRLTLPIRIYGGWLTADRRNGNQSGGEDWSNSYFYVGGTADLAYALTDFCTISGGVRYSYLTEKSADMRYNYTVGGHDQHLWFGAKVDFGF